jgi:hypothetical protein
MAFSRTGNHGDGLPPTTGASRNSCAARSARIDASEVIMGAIGDDLSKQTASGSARDGGGRRRVIRGEGEVIANAAADFRPGWGNCFPIFLQRVTLTFSPGGPLTPGPSFFSIPPSPAVRAVDARCPLKRICRGNLCNGNSRTRIARKGASGRWKTTGHSFRRSALWAMDLPPNRNEQSGRLLLRLICSEGASRAKTWEETDPLNCLVRLTGPRFEPWCAHQNLPKNQNDAKAPAKPAVAVSG